MTAIELQETINPFVFHGDKVFDWIDQPKPGKYRMSRTICVDLGKVTICAERGWWFDGASGPAIDGVSNMLAALVHDKLYELIERGQIDLSYWEADIIYYQICRAQGTHWLRAGYHYGGLTMFGWAYRLAKKLKR
jgi:hypothetical protein